MSAETPEWVSFRRARGVVWIRSNTAGALEGRWVGHFDIADFEPMRQEMERRCAAATRWRWCADLSEMEGFSPEFRNAWVEWFRTHRKSLERTVFLHKSALVRIGLSMVNIALGGLLEGYSDRAAYEAAVVRCGLSRVPAPAGPAAAVDGGRSR